MNDYIIAVSVALFWVWEKRNHGWTYFLGALTGKYALPSAQAPGQPIENAQGKAVG